MRGKDKRLQLVYVEFRRCNPSFENVSVTYFTTDTVSSNDTCTEFSGAEFRFDNVARHIRCMRQVLNPVAKVIMMGDLSANEPDMVAFKQQFIRP